MLLFSSHLALPPPRTASGRARCPERYPFLGFESHYVFHQNKIPTRLGGYFVCGGERGIRTLGTVLAFTRFPIVRLRPAQPSLHRELCARPLYYNIKKQKINTFFEISSYFFDLFLKNIKNLKNFFKKRLTFAFRCAIISPFRENMLVWLNGRAADL